MLIANEVIPTSAPVGQHDAVAKAAAETLKPVSRFLERNPWFPDHRAWYPGPDLKKRTLMTTLEDDAQRKSLRSRLYRAASDLGNVDGGGKGAGRLRKAGCAAEGIPIIKQGHRRLPATVVG